MNSRPRLGVQWGTTSREFDQDRVVLGREADCDVVVDDARASRHHLVFFRDGDVWVVSDASSNGSFVHGQRIQQFAVPPVSTVLNLGDPNGEPVTVVDGARPLAGARPARSHPAAARRRCARGTADRAVGRRLGASGPGAGQGVAQQVLPPGQLAHGHTILPADRNRDGTLDDRPRADQRGGADRPAGLAVPRPAGPGSGAGAPRPRQLQRHVRQRAAGAGLGRRSSPGTKSSSATRRSAGTGHSWSRRPPRTSSRCTPTG